ncbi:MAG: hypothetical protein G01um101448_946 [Parcubacteria group bacterium Gr01-1014_48]|nr:MAG: hypothetical protein Greene041614_1140 [Parcubacteria group bacterium Greene0416_14]TSC72571.1 MAG: hypothetical protein G01um101448_946 [Parcubacteria group bacterium Gr01-1014_48]TSC99575.1 MAG: hypothetical protein Greene101415_1143 [Parcubacteria group bacterium Greene1014_15]TSD07225.1 MAG: hypothetical protein Greene07144_966 [Parcubacteria group bacterium Greene0714_4]
MNKDAYISITRIFFACIAFLHLARFFYGWEVSIGTVFIPTWVSIAALFFAGIVSLNGFTLTKK